MGRRHACLAARQSTKDSAAADKRCSISDDDSIFNDVNDPVEAPPGAPIRISSSSLSDWESCPKKYYFGYVLKLKRPTNHALFFGRKFDEVLNYNYGNKKITDKDLPKADLQDYFRAGFDAEKDQVEMWEDHDPADLKEIGTKGVEAFANEVTPAVHIEEVQPKFQMTFEQSNVTLTGIPDFVEKSGTIGDNKTSGKSYGENKILQAHQPVIYSLSKDWDSDKPREVRYDVLVKTKKPKVQQLKLLVTKEYRDAELQYLSNAIDSIRAMILSKNFPPTAFHRGSWDCGYCAYSDTCRKLTGLPIPYPKTKPDPLPKKYVEINEKLLQKVADEAVATQEVRLDETGSTKEVRRSIIL